MKKTSLSIIIPAWNAGDMIKRILSSIYKNVDKNLGLEVIVSDDASSDNTSEIVKKNFPQVKLIETKKNKGFAGNNNQAIKIAKGDFIALMGQDVYLNKNPFPEIFNFFKNHPKAGGLTPKLLYPDGRNQFICRSFPTLRNLFFQTLVDLRILPDNPRWGRYKRLWQDQNKIQKVDQFDVSFSIWRRELLQKKLKGFDEKNFPSYFNDVDLCFRAKKLGYKLYYFPKVSAIHDHGQSYGVMAARKRLNNWHGNIKRFYLKHYVKNKFSFDYIILSLLLWLRSVLANLTGIHLKSYKKKSKSSRITRTGDGIS